jgi:hypothetical protein
VSASSAGAEIRDATTHEPGSLGLEVVIESPAAGVFGVSAIRERPEDGPNARDVFREIDSFVSSIDEKP